jgi:flagellar biosynthesis protein
MSDEKLKKAVALKYAPDIDRAPRMTAKGKGQMAEQIIQLAKEQGIPIKEDPDLIGLLIHLDWHEEIPPDLYKAVAEILAFVYKLNKKEQG